MDDGERTEADAGRCARRDLPVKVRKLAEEGKGADVMPGTAAERLAALEELTRTAFELAGRTIPDYRREETPIKVVSRDGTSPSGTTA